MSLNNSEDLVDLPIYKKFELERFSRAIESTTDLKKLQDLSKQLMKAWMVNSEMLKAEMARNLPVHPIHIKEKQ